MVDVDVLLNKASEAFDTAIALKSQPEWQVSVSEGNFTTSRMNSDTGIDYLKVEYYVNADPRITSRKFFENASEYSARVANDTCEFHRVIQKFSEDTCTYHVRLRGVAVVSPREFTAFGVWLELSETSFAIIVTGVDLPDVAISEDAVKCKLLFELHLFEALAGDMTKTCYTSIAKIDPMGSIPSAIVNTKLSSRGQEIKKLVDLAAA
mmetsp:Transcript_16655/g.29951  ORF Transcript_16655/g.29951 Transcript_16655/m.29951 type:complete len:208 (-) Transcript_16655:234-857(-)|eukprot:CAMPEP_0204896650 /NCGR_PEP_ID=MMETSP1397-20131031/286_1 /ASSEMBLY_ACC=CAM_ASM_000891 /TAXON_ID=49980 /ORGANISM="Climacostomum Climacostomum virens, Strain Stock W-24" /LENGTH=207 /DNA_ID=CAMNT_0052064295 /DNA_START=192 /DNA_END=815 /DNA_ORIENTATION=-